MTPLVTSDAFRTPFLMAGSGGGMNGGGCGRRGDMVDCVDVVNLKNPRTKPPAEGSTRVGAELDRVLRDEAEGYFAGRERPN